MRVSLIFPNTFTAYPATRTHQPLSLAYLAAVLRSDGHDVQVIDATAETLSWQNITDRMRAHEPSLVGITTNVGMAKQSILLARYVKRSFPSTKLVMGGPWATIEHERLLSRDIADIVVRGEGEATASDLAKTMERGGNLITVQGISYKDGTTIIHNPDRPLLMDIDGLPFPAWDLFPPSKHYVFQHRRGPFYPIMTSRGCPFDCIHCTKIVHGYTYRARSPENVLEEIRYLKDHFNAREIFIVDDAFNLDPDRAERIMDGIIKERLDLTIKFSNGIRADRLPPRLIKKLKAAGTYAVLLGIESGNQQIVKNIGKGLDLQVVVDVVKQLRASGFIVGGFFMLGHPQDTMNTMLQTIAFAKRLDLDYPVFYKAIPFPGTKLHDMVSRHGRFVVQMSNVDEYNMKSATFEMWNVHAPDVERAFKLAYRTLYLRPRRIFRLLSQFRTITELAWMINTVLKIFVKNR